MLEVWSLSLVVMGLIILNPLSNHNKINVEIKQLYDSIGIVYCIMGLLATTTNLYPIYYATTIILYGLPCLMLTRINNINTNIVSISILVVALWVWEGLNFVLYLLSNTIIPYNVDNMVVTSLHIMLFLNCTWGCNVRSRLVKIDI